MRCARAPSAAFFCAGGEATAEAPRASLPASRVLLPHTVRTVPASQQPPLPGRPIPVTPASAARRDGRLLPGFRSSVCSKASARLANQPPSQPGTQESKRW
jgi:hypothetical protein